MMMKIALLVACVVVAVYCQEKQSMVGMQMCGTTYCQAGQMCSYQGGYPRCVMSNMGGMYPGMNNGMYPGMNNGMYPGMNNGMYPGMNNGMYPGMGNGMYGGMAMTEEDKPATAPKVGDETEEEEAVADITTPL
ncbi:hypothetical protein LOTGIDRAFT_237221 [Lottia gigantea]|uniref:Uncharacterized protein n=1 Tax=Lottia gigantea TaxID=225164 RepID=V4B126_LOTGI|nr:hypothetical protein LOTGIDRAFT_237221 [Lottia gigantea]ESO81914.1 hypothetical protein LOTGIDRAFT_237221 [Lottia gigantea]